MVRQREVDDDEGHGDKKGAVACWGSNHPAALFLEESLSHKLP